MSTENITNFVAAVRADAALQARANADLAQSDGPERLAVLSAEVGIPFTAEEFLAYQRSLPGGELADGDLDRIAGGNQSSRQCFGQGCGGAPPW